MPTYITSGWICRKYGVLPWQIEYAFRRGLLRASGKCGRYRFWTKADLPHVEQALRQAGYLKAEAVHA